ncbi:glutathione S-transferase A4 isoform X1 [Bos indicus x Bos taurus]|uniref:glutathione transferase n=1 Tax=Bos taurus TaxID=9913 RepID=A0A3Q1MHS2_BOVIN|nr:glutathione S-transferase A4 isoform X1 [Bos indicus x Bos taurus]
MRHHGHMTSTCLVFSVAECDHCVSLTSACSHSMKFSSVTLSATVFAALIITVVRGYKMFDEEFLETKEQLQKLQDGNHLLFQQVPMVEIDGMKLVQTRSILHYIADKHHLFGKDLKERTLIDMYVEGTLDLLELLIMHPFLKPDDQQKEVANMAQKAIIRYFPVFEKVLRGHGQRFLVGNQLSLADIILLQTILALEEKIPNILSAFPHLQEYTVKISNIPTIKKFLEPGSKKKPPPDDIYVRTVYNIFMP